MSATAHKTHDQDPAPFHVIIILSAWGFVLVVASFLFLWLGRLLDELLGTAPKFMLGLFFLAIIGCFIELYQEVLKIMKDT
jgi:Ca2+/H+ antiporter